MSIAERIEDKVKRAFAPVAIELVNESYKHKGGPTAETHFSLLVVSAAFVDQSRVARQRAVLALFDDERAAGLHALSLRTLTPDEHEQAGGGAAETPSCEGGDGRVRAQRA